MAGYVVRKIKKVLNCEVCVSALTEDDSLISSCDWCEKQFKANVHTNLSQINVLQLVNLTALSFVGENMFSALTIHVMQQSPLECHSSIL